MKKIFLLFLAFPFIPAQASKFQKIETYLFEKPDEGMKTEAFVLQQNGKIVFSRYDHGSPESLHLLWSMSKSVMSLLFGIAEGKGFISREDRVYKYFPKEIESFPKTRLEAWKRIKMSHLLQMSSGLDWKEFYEEGPFRSHVVKMLYLKSTGSMAKYVLQTPVARAPGEFFLYSSGDTNLLAGALRRSLPEKLQNNYPWKWFFEPLEMEAVFEQDGAGNFVGSSHVYLKTKDLLKIGQLIIDQGVYQGKQIVPKKYISHAVSLSESMRKRGCLKDSYMTYGAHFWLNKACPNGARPFEQIPEDLVMLLGHGGQSVFIFPSENIVAVRIAQDKEQALNKRKFSALILEALK